MTTPTPPQPNTGDERIIKRRWWSRKLVCSKCGAEHTLKAHDELLAGEKACTKCHIVQPFDNFSRRSADVSVGRLSTCKSCASLYQQEYYDKHKAKLLAASKERDATNKHVIAWQANQREIRTPEKRLARRRLSKAVHDGIIKKLPCQMCSDIHSEFHHSNGYTEPNWYVGMWLCHDCHAAVHKDIRRKAKEVQREQLRNGIA